MINFDSFSAHRMHTGCGCWSRYNYVLINVAILTLHVRHNKYSGSKTAEEIFFIFTFLLRKQIGGGEGRNGCWNVVLGKYSF